MATTDRAAIEQRLGESAFSRPDFEDHIACHGTGRLGDPREQRGLPEEVLTQRLLRPHRSHPQEQEGTVVPGCPTEPGHFLADGLDQFLG